MKTCPRCSAPAPTDASPCACGYTFTGGDASTRPAPTFTAASWLLPAVGALITWGLFGLAVTRRGGGELLPGMAELIIGSIVIAFCAFGCGLTALLRRERRCGLAVLPFLAGLGTILYFVRNLLR